MRRTKDSAIMTMIITLTVLGLVETASANVVCKKSGRFWYPENAKAIQIAKALRVKTCNGKRFKAVIKEAGLSSNVVSKPRQQTVKELVASLKAK